MKIATRQTRERVSSRRSFARWLTAAAPLQACSASLILHAGALLWFGIWVSEDPEPFSLDGQRQILALSLEATPDSSAAWSLDPPRARPASPPTQAAARASLPEPARRATPPGRPPPAFPSPLAVSPPATTPPASPRSPANRPAEIPQRPAVRDQPRQLPRRPLRPPSVPPSASRPPAPPQSLGLEPSVRPDLSDNAFPEYPPAAVAQRLEGTVLLRLWIDATGQVQRVELASSSGHPLLDAAAVKAVRTWRGSPAERDHHPVATEELLPIRFRL